MTRTTGARNEINSLGTVNLPSYVATPHRSGAINANSLTGSTFIMAPPPFFAKTGADPPDQRKDAEIFVSISSRAAASLSFPSMEEFRNTPVR
jgi:hypothetical protein